MFLKITKNISNNKLAHFEIEIESQLINLSSDLTINCHQISELITSQIKNAYVFLKTTYSCSIKIKIDVIKKENQIRSNKLLFCLTTKVINNNIAQANFKGGIIKINTEHLNQIKSEYNRTIPHELGHIFGWDHPHANGKYESINPESDPLFEQTLNETEIKNNLMSQSWYIQNSGKSLNEGKEISLNQLELLLKNFKSNQLGNSLHLKGWWFWKKVRL